MGGRDERAMFTSDLAVHAGAGETWETASTFFTENGSAVDVDAHAFSVRRDAGEFRVEVTGPFDGDGDPVDFEVCNGDDCPTVRRMGDRVHIEAHDAITDQRVRVVMTVAEARELHAGLTTMLRELDEQLMLRSVRP